MRSVVFKLGLVFAVLLWSVGASANVYFLKDATALSDTDRAAMREALGEILRQYRAGAEASWETETRGGTASLIETFDRDGMECALVHHVFTKGGGYSYEIPLCKVADGSWKIAF